VVVTHPFHPLKGRSFVFHSRRTSGGVPLVHYLADDGTLASMPVSWTDLRGIDDFERVSSGRSLFRADDLVALRVLVDSWLDLRPDSRGDRNHK